jgi:hypothetical protein
MKEFFINSENIKRRWEDENFMPEGLKVKIK